MIGRDLYFDDFRVGDRFESPGATLTESLIIDFALTYDPQPFHLDASRSHFGAVIASGFQTLALAFRLFYQTGVFASANLGGPGIDELRWLKPVRAGDTIRSVVEIVELRPSTSKPDRGTLRFRLTGLNQHDETVLSAVFTVVFKRRPA